MNKKALVGLATLNESENILELISELDNLEEKLDILVVDGNSTDGTIESVKNLFREKSGKYLIIQKENMGLASAHLCMYKFAIENQYDLLITLDADLSHDPKEINRFIQIAESDEEVALVIGSRYMKNGKTDNRGYRLLVSKFANKFASLVIGGNLNEYTTSFRLFHLKYLSQIDSGSLDSKGYSFFFRMMFEFLRKQFLVIEIPIHFHERKRGKSKIPKLEIFKSFAELTLIHFKRKETSTLLGDVLPACQGCESSLTIGINPRSQHAVGIDERKKDSYLIFCTICGSINN